jgi:hypothetical protein
MRHNKLLCKLSAALLGWLLPLASVFAQTNAPAPSLCTNRGYVIAFFNGVWNDESGGDSGREALGVLFGSTYNSEPLIAELFYNHTGPALGATALQDLAETFIQRAHELDTSGALETRFEFLWEIISDSDQSLWDRLIAAVPAAADLHQALITEFRAQTAAALSHLLSNPPTTADYGAHDARLDELILEGQKLLLVGHSQGNLFVNQAYDHALPTASAGSIGAVHIAPASPTLRGGYVLADIDLVIGALSAEFPGSVPPPNLTLPFSSRDLSGHELIATYLDAARPGRGAVRALMNGTLSTLVTPAAHASQGFFTITLTWDGPGDVDLHTFEPNGVHVYYASRQGTSGFLDVDNVVANGPEHYFASCDPGVLQTGSYQIGINDFARAAGRLATVQAASAQTGSLLTRTLDVGPERGPSGNSSPIPVMTVTVTKDASTGAYSVTAH